MRPPTRARYGSRMLDPTRQPAAPRSLDRTRSGSSVHVLDRALELQRRWLNQTTLDLAMATVLGAIAVFAHLIPRLWGLARPDGAPHTPTIIPAAGLAPIDLLGLGLALLQTVPIASRRTAPIPVLAITGGATVASSALGFDSALGGFAVLIALYSVAAHTDRRTSAMALGVTAVALGVAVLASVDRIVGLNVYIGNLLLYGSAWLVGDNRRVRRAYTRELEARAERLERDREAEAARAVQEERGRIARELHDVVTHSVTVMTVQASAARRVLRASPDDADTALAAVESTGRDALAEMRRLLGVLRTDAPGSDLDPQPGLDRIDDLVTLSRAAGLPIDLEIDGDQRPLPSGVDLAAYRIVQEALTNSLKHAGRARATVHLGYEPGALDIRVTDDGRGAAATLASGSGDGDHRGARHGLIGMRERIALYGGELEAGPRAEGGYLVHARIPFDREP
jgi:signal transduction histidine kinase